MVAYDDTPSLWVSDLRGTVQLLETHFNLTSPMNHSPPAPSQGTPCPKARCGLQPLAPQGLCTAVLSAGSQSFIRFPCLVPSLCPGLCSNVTSSPTQKYNPHSRAPFSRPSTTSDNVYVFLSAHCQCFPLEGRLLFFFFKWPHQQHM